MRGAGAILLGKTNCPPYGGGIETDNPVYGRTSNPYDLARTPGGSSGGEAAIVAAAGSACGVGTDSGAASGCPRTSAASRRSSPPRAGCPVTGVIDDEGQIGALGDPRTQVGPLARSVADVALLLGVLAGPDGRDGGVPPVPLGDPRGVRRARPARRRVRRLRPRRGRRGDGGRAGATRPRALREAGAPVEEAAPPAGGHDLTIEVWRSYGGGLDSLELYRLLRRWDAFRAAMLAFGERLRRPPLPRVRRPGAAPRRAGGHAGGSTRRASRRRTA